LKILGSHQIIKILFDLRVDADYFHTKKVNYKDALQLKEDLCKRILGPIQDVSEEDIIKEYKKIKSKHK
jgi:hypothetical protein